MEIKPIELADGLEFAAEVQGGTIITIRKDGRPQSSDVHHAITHATIVFSVLPTRAKVFNIERDPRVVYHVSHEGSYLSFDGTAIVSPVATETHGPAMDILIEAYRAAAKKEHPDWDEFRDAMVRERRRVIIVSPDSVVGLIRPVWG
ncbi:MAG: TIGR03618 family F420-dependent PPOX class oxidoreductase [Acidimicrobiaceae bacterium]|nr:TIGR03618 family F420-dependent PPOX class oxidoreductase [Acidimicrobiaceae bacterium]